MSSERLSAERFRRFDASAVDEFPAPHFLNSPITLPAVSDVDAETLNTAIDRTTRYFLNTQHPEGYWVGELEGDSILQSEFLLLLAYLEEERSEIAQKVGRYLLHQQNERGGWSLYPGGPSEPSATVKAYFALKLVGEDPNSPAMQAAKAEALRLGGVEAVNSFTRYYLALLGQIPYHRCPAVPPELVLMPRWFPINLAEMSAWSRTIFVPLSILWAYQPVRKLPEELGIRELFHGDPRRISMKLSSCDLVDHATNKSSIPWSWLFRRADQAIKTVEFLHLNPVRRYAIGKAKDWMLTRFEESDGLGAIFPPIIWSVVALKCLGYDDDSPEIQSQREELNKLMIETEQGIKLQPCKSPVWDTAITLVALSEANVEPRSAPIRKAVDWLINKEVRTPGDWTAKCPGIEPSGWFFEFNNKFYPDIDDTIMVLMALGDALPCRRGEQWEIEFSVTPEGPITSVATKAHSEDPKQTLATLTEIEPALEAFRRGLTWVAAMQSRDHGWGAFDSDNDLDLLTRVPFADHNAMIDPSTADITARVLEMFGRFGISSTEPMVQAAINYVLSEQEPDGAWYGRWGVNYIYGTWQALVGLAAVGLNTKHPAMVKGVEWLVQHQNEDGGWGESIASYDDPSLRGIGPSTASQTAWALMGLMAGGAPRQDATRRGVEYLLRTQQADGTWDEPEFTGTGFPKVFYLKYHLYSINFPLMALARYRKQCGGQSPM